MQRENRRTNPDRTAATRALLLSAARNLFAEKSYAETGTPEIVAAAGVTRGALYHHFPDKRALFRAVVVAEQQAVAGAIASATPRSLPALDALLAGSDAFFAAMAAPGRARLLLLDGPAVLGRAEMDQIDLKHGSAGALREGLAAVLESDGTLGAPLDALTALLSAAFDRAALATADGSDPSAYAAAVRLLVEGLARTAATH